MAPVRRRSYASVIIVPPQRDQPLNFNLPAWSYYLALTLLAALVVMVVGGAVLTGWMATQLRHLRAVEARNLALEEEAAKVAHLERELDRFEDFRLRVLDLAGADVKQEIEARAHERLEARAPGTPPPGPATDVATGSGEPAAADPAPAGVTASAAVPADPAPSVAAASGTLPSMWPVEGVISKEYRMEGGAAALHHGIDIAASFRTPVRASGAGTVAYAGRDSIFGLLVVLDHGKEVRSYYGHNSSLEVGVGDRVRRGDVIARVGSTGESSAPHLHFEVRREGAPIDPRTFLID